MHFYALKSGGSSLWKAFYTYTTSVYGLCINLDMFKGKILFSDNDGVYETDLHTASTVCPYKKGFVNLFLIHS